MNNISKSKTIAMNLIDYDAREAQKESKSVFQGEGYQILVGRKHEGDENDKTWCKFASLSLEGIGLPSWLAGVIVEKVRDVEIKKESKSDIQCSDGEVIMGRTHIGDENDLLADKIIRLCESKNAFAWPYFYAVNFTNSVQNDWLYYPLAISAIKSG